MTNTEQGATAPGTLTVKQMALWLQEGYAPLPVWSTQLGGNVDASAETNLYVDGGVDFGQRQWSAQGTWGLFWRHGEAVRLEELMNGARRFKDVREASICQGYDSASSAALPIC